jgi:uncharacterized protein (TIGR00645 family)
MNKLTRNVARIIFLGRWLQAPMYLGLLVVLGAYVYRFLVELVHIMGNIRDIQDTQIMLGVLNLIDVVMIANLLIMVVMGGYETFVSKLHLQDNPDQPEWLSEVDAGVMKIKLALALIGISSIHLLRVFIEPGTPLVFNYSVMWQVIIHLTLIVSAMAIAMTNRIMHVEKVKYLQS